MLKDLLQIALPINQKGINRTLSITENSSFHANLVAPHNCVVYVDFSGILGKELLTQALDRIQNIFPCLSCHIDFNLSEIKLKSKDIKIPLIISTLGNDEECDQLFEKEINSPFDLCQGPLIRFTYLIGNNHGRLIITFHHLICDGLSISYFVEQFFETIEAIKLDLPMKSIEFGFEKLEDLLQKKDLDINDDKSVLFQNEPNLLYGYTKAINFTVKKNNKKNPTSLTYFILAIAGMALRKILDHNITINYIIPVNMRPFATQPISHYQLGFYSSWIEFKQHIGNHDDYNELAKDFHLLTKNAIEENQHIKNFLTLKKSYCKPSGIINNILTSKNTSLCISNVGKINIKTLYAENTLKINSMYLGLNSYYRSKNCFLLIANGLGEHLHFTFLYTPPYMDYEFALEITRFIKNTIKEFS